MRHSSCLAPALLVLALSLLASGCGSPDKVNLTLRRQRDEHLAEIKVLREQLAAHRLRIEALENQQGTLQTLPQSRLDQLFTTRDITLGRLSGGADLDPSRPGDEAVKVYLTPMDESGTPSKSTGEVTVELFNLDRRSDARIAQWHLSPQQLKEHWRGLGPLNAFVLTFPLEEPAPQSNLLLRVSFRDELTGRSFSKTQAITVQVPPTTQASR